MLFCKTPSFAAPAGASSAQNSSDANIIDEMKRREQAIYNRISATKDPVEKQALRDKLAELQNLYSNREIRTEFIRKNNPKYAAAVEASNNNSSSIRYITPTNNNSWDNLANEDKISVCKQTLVQCNKNKDLYYCRFAVTKCKNYIDKVEYDELVKSFKNRQ